MAPFVQREKSRSLTHAGGPLDSGVHKEE
jgi:hypothetical protein